VLGVELRLVFVAAMGLTVLSIVGLDREVPGASGG
jgi:hypothetical protein